MLKEPVNQRSSSVFYPSEDIFGEHKPLLALYDLDRGIDSAGNPSSGLLAIARLADRARAIRLPIAHVFLESTEGGRAVQSLNVCRPQPSDMVFERVLLSCFSAEYFSDVANRFSERGIVLCGCGTATAMATLFDAQRAGVRAHAVVDRILPIAEQQDAFDRGGMLSLMDKAGIALSGRTWPYAECLTSLEAAG